MTQDEAEGIIRLSNYPEAESLLKVQAELLAKLESNMLSRNYSTPLRQIDFESGLYKGKSLFSLRGMKDEARKVIRE